MTASTLAGPAFGMATSVFGHRLALTPAKIKQLAGTGVEWIEISALQEQHLGVWDSESVNALLAARQTLGLKVWSFHAPFCGIAMDDADTRADGVRRIIQSARVAQQLGATRVVVHPGRDVPVINAAREQQWTVENTLRALEKMPDGMCLALETMGTGADILQNMLARLPAERVGACVDTGHVNLQMDVAACIAGLSGRVMSVHLQDNHGQADDHLLPGSGRINWPAVLTALRQAGYRGVLMCEGGDPGNDPAANAREYARRMREWCGALDQ
jgi:sugar phosphate isomerase/epimerase